MRIGQKRDRDEEKLTSYAWSAFAPATDTAPDTDTVINVIRAKSIAIQIDTTAAGNISNDIDINVEASPDGTNWDDVPYAEKNIGDNEIKTFLVEPGPQKIRLRADNNHASDNAAPAARVMVRE